MYTELIYDFDGTLADTYPVFTDCMMELLARHGIKADRETVYAQLKVTIANAISCYDWGEFSKKEITKEFKEIRNAYPVEKQHPIEGAREILELAIKQGRRNYVYTRSDGIVAVLLKSWGMDHLFTYIIDSKADFRPKPEPDALNWLCEEYKLDKSKCLMIGDRDLDTESGTNAGMKNVMFDPEGFYTNTPADYRIDALSELAEVMEGKRG